MCMYETDIFVKFKFRFIGMLIFITNEAQIDLTYHVQKGHKLILYPERWTDFLTLSDVKRATSVNSFTYQLSWQFVLSFPNFYLSEFSTLKEHRQDSYLIHGIFFFYVRSLWNAAYFGNSTNCLSLFTVNSVMNVIFTALSSPKYCLPSRWSSFKLSFLSENLLCHFYTDERLN
jgi:hypothetical protein